MSCESYDLRLTTLSPIHIGSGKSYSCCEFVPAKAKSKGQIVKIIKRVNLTNYYSSLSDDRKDTFLASLTNSNFELKQFDKKIKKDFVRYQCIDNSRVDFINEVQEHIKTSDKLYIPGSSIKGAIRTAIFYNLLTEEDMDKIGRDISSNRRNNSFLSNDLLKKHFTSGFGNDAQYNIFRFMQVADTTTTNLPRIEQVLAVMATDDRRKNQFYSRHGKVVKSYLETIGANKILDKTVSFQSFRYKLYQNREYLENIEPVFIEVYDSIDDPFIKDILMLERIAMATTSSAVGIVASQIYTPTKDMPHDKAVMFYQNMVNRIVSEINQEKQNGTFDEETFYKNKTKQATLDNISVLGISKSVKAFKKNRE